ncbi:hypothetical protein NEIELOOT_01051 [Neisseria elongata subsp. glycolytica ATCC 29315]|uniref:Uncharacterized protein n=1 Tax=Neisseria elongata subsp. glycolytica ATCC 29315 TaxID=546263 RepID=D4DPR4_NEIEG|nr:hypothetical protein NEIELOOT_01051 [Neisseria elongata subsp. glycolytica ATCC 29315]
MHISGKVSIKSYSPFFRQDYFALLLSSIAYASLHSIALNYIIKGTVLDN